jgi:hypothetical protein
MDVYRPLRGGLFFYELVRFGAALCLPGLFEAFGGGTFPYLACISPNALFLMMALFLWLRPGEFRVYLPLYMAGKVLSILAFAAWCVFSVESLTGLIPFIAPEQLWALAGVLLASAGDALAFGGAWALRLKLQERAAAGGPAAGAQPGLPEGPQHGQGGS